MHGETELSEREAGRNGVEIERNRLLLRAIEMLAADPATDLRALVPQDSDNTLILYSELRAIREQPTIVSGMEGPVSAPGRGDLPEGTMVGRYRIGCRIGQGGMGSVYSAWDTLLARNVVLKTVRRDRVCAEAADRFRAEAQALAKLDHESICRIHDIVEDEAAGIAIILPFVPGKPLGHHPTEPDFFVEFRPGPDEDPPAAATPAGPRPAHGQEQARPGTRREVLQAVGVLERVARAIGAAHRAGLVHRDIKPANILVRPDGVPVVLDFGLATSLAGGADAYGDRRSGSAPYMAPEQVEGGDPIDMRTDVYALGVLIYQVLAGRHPYGQARGREEFFAHIVQTIPDPLREVNRAVPADLAAVVHKAMAKDRSARFADANELADELHRFLRGLSVRTSPLSFPALLTRQARRHPAIAGLALLLILSCAAAIMLLEKKVELDRGLELSQRYASMLEIIDTLKRENRAATPVEVQLLATIAGNDPDFVDWIASPPGCPDAEARIRRRIITIERSGTGAVKLPWPRGRVVGPDVAFIAEGLGERDRRSPLAIRMTDHNGDSVDYPVRPQPGPADRTWRLVFADPVALPPGDYIWSLHAATDGSVGAKTRRIADGGAFAVSTAAKRDAILAPLAGVPSGASDARLDAILAVRRAYALLRSNYFEDAEAELAGLSLPGDPGIQARIHTLRAELALHRGDAGLADIEFGRARAPAALSDPAEPEPGR